MTKEELQLVQSHTIVVLLREIWRSIKSKVSRRSKVQSKLAAIATEIYSAKIHVSFGEYEEATSRLLKAHRQVQELL